MSAQHTLEESLRRLAELALPMPWEEPKNVPFHHTHKFRAAITPADYMELIEQRDDLLAALQRLSDQCERLRLPDQATTCAELNALAVLDRATGGAS